MKIINRVSEKIPLTILASKDQDSLVRLANDYGLITSGSHKKVIILGAQAKSLCLGLGILFATKEEIESIKQFYNGEL